MFQILSFSLIVFLTACMTTRPPTLDPLRPPEKNFSRTSPYDEIDRLLDGPFENPQRNPAEDFSPAPPDRQSSLHLGMPKRNVQMRLGSPTEVEVAGQPQYGNERWTYEDAFSTPDGYVRSTKMIYFENHKVVGWESD